MNLTTRHAKTAILTGAILLACALSADAEPSVRVHDASAAAPMPPHSALYLTGFAATVGSISALPADVHCQTVRMIWSTG